MESKRIIIIVCLLVGILSVEAKKSTGEDEVFTLLTNTEVFPSEEGHLLTIPNLGLFYTDEGILYPLDSVKSQNISQIRLRDTFPIDELIVHDSTFLAKSQKYVLEIDANCTKIVTELDTEVFNIYPGYDGKYNLVVQEDSASWAWYRYDLKTNKIDCVTRTNEPISWIVDAHAGAFCAVGKCIYMVTSDSMALLTVADKQILDMVMTRVGMLFCTDNTLYNINADLQAEVVAIGSFHSFYYDNGTLYAVLKNGDIMRTEITALFQ